MTETKKIDIDSDIEEGELANEVIPSHI